MKIAILTDSTCDLPRATLERHGIEAIPLHIQMGAESLIDGVNITKEEFYARLPDYDPAPSTAAPSPDLFIERFRTLARQGYDAILSIHISEALSATVNSARTAAQQFAEIPVSVLDSRQLSLGLGFLVERAAQLAQGGTPLRQITDAIKALGSRTYVFAALDTLEYLRRSGRMHAAVARFGNLLRLKPLLHMNLGDPQAFRTRTRSNAQARLFSWLEAYAPLERLAVLHAGVQGQAEALREEVRRYWPAAGDVPIVQITPVLGAHLGIGALGFACISAKTSGPIR